MNSAPAPPRPLWPHRPTLSGLFVPCSWSMSRICSTFDPPDRLSCAALTLVMLGLTCPLRHSREFQQTESFALWRKHIYGDSHVSPRMIQPWRKRMTLAEDERGRLQTEGRKTSLFFCGLVDAFESRCCQRGSCWR